MSLKKSFARSLSHVLFQPGRAKKGFLLKYCSGIKHKKILEIGSGKRINGKLVYSVVNYFRSNNNEVVLTDIDPKLGHKLVDITKSVPKGFAVIVCLNVLEHVFDFHSSLKNFHKSLKKGGQLIVLVPAFYPLHDEPHDYWRFTRNSLRVMFDKFQEVDIKWSGFDKYPFNYFVKATKK